MIFGAVGTAPGVFVAFGAGVLSFLSPCVLPLVPGYLSLMSGLSAAEVEEASGETRRRVVYSSLLFIAGFSLVFIAYGAVASGLGSALVKHQKGLTQLSGIFVIFMGLVVANVLPSKWLSQERRLQVSPSRLGPYAAPVMGMAFAFGWTPCIGPVLASVLTLAAARDTLSQGVLLLAAYSAGLGVPFLIAGVAFGRMRSTWSWCKAHGRQIDLVSGALLVVFGVLLLTSDLTRLSAWVVSFWTFIGLDRLSRG